MAYILIIDDDADFADSLALVLRRSGHEVAFEPGTEAGYRSIVARRPDLVILDVMFPSDSTAGFRLATMLRSNHGLGKLPVLMLSAINQAFPLDFGGREGDNDWLKVSEFLEKPVDLKLFVQKVESLLGAIETT